MPGLTELIIYAGFTLLGWFLKRKLPNLPNLPTPKPDPVKPTPIPTRLDELIQLLKDLFKTLAPGERIEVGGLKVESAEKDKERTFTVTLNK